MKRLFILALTTVIALCTTGCQQGGEATGLAPSTATVHPRTPAEYAAAEAEIRQAVSLLLDRNYVTAHISRGGETPAASFVADGMSDANGGNFALNAGGGNGYYSVAKEDYEANVRQAIEILRKYYDFDGRQFIDFPRLTYIYNTGDNHKKIAEYLQSTLAKYGIRVSLQNQEWATFLSTRQQGNYELARHGWTADYTDPICFLDMWTTDSGNNDIQFGKGAHKEVAVYDLDLTDLGYDVQVENGTWAQTYDRLIALIKTCADQNTRYALMHRAEDLLMSTGCVTPLYFSTDLYLLDPAVEGVYAIPLGYKYFHRATRNGKSDTLSVSFASEPETLDPAKNATADGASLLVHLFSGLAKWELDEEGHLTIRPDCAEALPEGVQNPDGTVTYTYTLKEGLTWSDGVPLTAGDFEYAWKRAADPALGASYGYLYDVVAGYGTDQLAVKAPDDRHLQVTLSGPVAYWNELLAFPTFFPVRQDVVQNTAWATEAATYVSNGPYTLTRWDHKASLTLNRNPTHHGDATLEELKVYLSDDANNMLTNFRSGAWQMIDQIPTNEIPGLKGSRELVSASQIGTYYLCWNVNEPLLPPKK